MARHKAEEDMKASDALLAAEPLFLYPACFHAQQAAEKYPKALLAWHQIEFRKTHDIQELLDWVAQADPALSSNLKVAFVLTPYGVDVRYPGDAPEPGLKEAQEAADLARKVRNEVLRVLPFK